MNSYKAIMVTTIAHFDSLCVAHADIIDIYYMVSARAFY